MQLHIRVLARRWRQTPIPDMIKQRLLSPVTWIGQLSERRKRSPWRKCRGIIWEGQRLRWFLSNRIARLATTKRTDVNNKTGTLLRTRVLTHRKLLPQIIVTETNSNTYLMVDLFIRWQLSNPAMRGRFWRISLLESIAFIGAIGNDISLLRSWLGKPA